MLFEGGFVLAPVQGRSRERSRLEDSVNSARETMMALRLAGACGYLSAREADAGRAELDGIIAVLWTLAYRR